MASGAGSALMKPIYRSAGASYVNGFTDCQRPAYYSARQISMVLVDMLVNRGRPLCLTAGGGFRGPWQPQVSRNSSDNPARSCSHVAS
jgi:hypothetical protein